MALKTDAPELAKPSRLRLRPIARLDLANFRPPVIPGNRGPAVRALWYVVSALLFQSTLPALIPSRLKAAILRAFGARIGRGFVCKPRVNIKYPWFLTVGDHVWLGEGVWIDNLCPVTIGANVCISQGCYLGTGNHDWNDPLFTFFARPITIGDGVWLTAFTRLGPGDEVQAGQAVLGVRE